MTVYIWAFKQTKLRNDRSAWFSVKWPCCATTKTRVLVSTARWQKNITLFIVTTWCFTHSCCVLYQHPATVWGLTCSSAPPLCFTWTCARLTITGKRAADLTIQTSVVWMQNIFCAVDYLSGLQGNETQMFSFTLSSLCVRSNATSFYLSDNHRELK